MASAGSFLLRRAAARAVSAGLVVGGIGYGSYGVLYDGSPGWLFSPTLRLLCYLQQPFTGLCIRFGSASGALGLGKLDVRDLHVAWTAQRLVPRKADCDLHFERLAIDVGAANANLILRHTDEFLEGLDSTSKRRAFVVERVAAEGVQGHYTALIRKPETPPPNVVINSLKIMDAKVQLGDRHGRTETLLFPPLGIELFTTEKIAFQNAAPALLLETDGTGTVGDAPFVFERRKRASAHVPVKWLSQFLQPPLSWLQKGWAGVDVTVTPSKTPDYSVVAVKLAVEGGEAEEDPSDSVYGAASGRLAAYLSSRRIAVTAKEEINTEDFSDGQRFLQQLNEKFAAVILRDGVVAGVNAAAAQLKKSGWFS